MMSERVREELTKLNERYLGTQLEPSTWKFLLRDASISIGTIKKYIEFEDYVQKYKLEPEEILDYLNNFFNDNWTDSNVPEFIYENGEYYEILTLRTWNGFKKNAV